jgi:hypothetical protein
MFDVVDLGIVGISGTDWKEKGGVTWAILEGTWGHLVRFRKIIIGVKWVFGKADGFATIILSSWYGGTLSAQLRGRVLKLT